MTPQRFLTALGGLAVGLFSAAALGHNYLVQTQAPAGYVHV